MKALVLKSDKKLVFETVADPKARTDREVLVEVRFSGICGSDIPRAFHGKAYHYPLIMGHEFSGIVREAPRGSAFAAGERVVVFPLLPCGKCAACSTGDYAQCADYDYLGSRRDGGFAEFVYVPEENLFRVPDRVELVSAAMTEPCAVALHGVEKLRIEAGMSALVIGGGPVGLMAAQWLRVKGCSSVRVADVDAKKLALAEGLGFESFDSAAADLTTAMQGQGGGMDCVVEACGLPATFLQAVDCAGRFGQVVFMGNIRGEFRVPENDFSRILRNELRISGTWNSKITPRGKDEWTRVLAFLDGAIDVRSLVSHRPPLSEGAEVFGRLVGREEWFSKVVFSL
ncbi:MAG: galactitol-1-phosphate 5-dehydrogenase [Rectinemataceae bacterium]|jgi:L-iditol 2-dehydrogenase/galactitol-1-phosphate 5-dehydrogenase